MSAEFTLFRKPLPSELRLISRLIDLAPDLQVASNWREMLRVKELPDGHMGSLSLALEDAADKSRQMGARVAELVFEDVDGVVVIVSLNVDECGRPFELDIWKTDFTPLVQIPEQLPGEDDES